MKKNKLMAIFAAAAMAAVSFLTPIADDIGFSVPASAVTSDGLWLSAPTDTPDPADKGSADNTKYINSLMPGDIVQLNLTVPDLETNLNGIQLKIKYDDSLVECVRWYQTGWERSKNEYISPTTGKKAYLYTDDELANIEGLPPYTTPWPAAGDYIGNGYGTGEANFKRTEFTDGAYLTLVSPTGENAINAFNGNVVTLFARFKVKSAATISHPEFEIIEHVFDDTTDTDVWDPADDQIKTTATIAGVIKGKITPYDFDNNPPVTIEIETPATVNWYTVPGVPFAGPVTTTDGNFEFKGLTPGLTYRLKITNVWCKNDKYEVSGDKFKNMTYDIGNWAIWLYGDVDNDGNIGASDATQILRYVVGKNSLLYGTGIGDDIYEIADVNEDDIVNVRDATQILKKAAGLASVFDGKP